MRFRDRSEAGKYLARTLNLNAYLKAPSAIVLGLPRGGVVVAYEVAKALELPLDVLIVRKLGVPRQDELAFGAIASGSTIILNNEIIQALYLKPEEIEKVRQKENQELQRREKLYRGNRPPSILKDKIIILVDDGIATGATMKAAIMSIHQHFPKRIIVAVPVAPYGATAEFENLVDELVICATPEPFWGVGKWYENFQQTTDEEVTQLLKI